MKHVNSFNLFVVIVLIVVAIFLFNNQSVSMSLIGPPRFDGGGLNPTCSFGDSITPVTGVMCPFDYSPVCGSDRKTYSNSCHASVSGACVVYSGVCKTEDLVTELPVSPPTMNNIGNIFNSLINNIWSMIKGLFGWI